MTWYQILFGVTLILSSIGIIVVVILQQGRQAGLSGAIAGGAETFFGKNKGRSIEARLAKVTKIIATAFFLIAFVASLLFMFI
ncbi:MAG: preprotein translocase subunit SecG [Firmicutes bacterium ADurb.Bin300]|jgi:preprotein translocase subunit SecG|nr:MAG: preprotein translocase subunit SecG [Firmicutes bacterium ADurb.Bin300]HOD02469.1 preprotein translocase subunit SecG [Clostridiales bacterium]